MMKSKTIRSHLSSFNLSNGSNPRVRLGYCFTNLINNFNNFPARLFAILVVLVGLQCHCVSAIPTPQEDVVCGFASTDIASSSGYEMWACDTDGLPTSDPCGWPGITCGVSGEVTAINLAGSNDLVIHGKFLHESCFVELHQFYS